VTVTMSRQTGARFTKYLTLNPKFIVGLTYDSNLQRAKLFPGNIAS